MDTSGLKPNNHNLFKVFDLIKKIMLFGGYLRPKISVDREKLFNGTWTGELQVDEQVTEWTTDISTTALHC